MKSCETALKEMIPRWYHSSIIKLYKYHFSIVQAHLSQISKILLLEFKWYFSKIHSFYIKSAIPRSQIVSYHIFSFKCHCSMISPNTGFVCYENKNFGVDVHKICRLVYKSVIDFFFLCRWGTCALKLILINFVGTTSLWFRTKSKLASFGFNTLNVNCLNLTGSCFFFDSGFRDAANSQKHFFTRISSKTSGKKPCDKL